MENMNPLTQIEEGMEVFDRDGKKVGSVTYVQMTDEDPANPGPETAGTTAASAPRDETLIDHLAEAFAGDEALTPELRRRLLHEGFIRIDSGLFKADRYATPAQISHVTEDGAYLKIEADKLIKRG